MCRDARRPNLTVGSGPLWTEMTIVPSSPAPVFVDVRQTM